MILVKERNGRSRSNLRLLDNHLSRLSPARFSSSQFPPDLPIHARLLAQLRKVSADSWRIPGSPCGAVSETASHPPCSLSGVQDPHSMTGRKTMLGLGRTMPALHAGSITRTLP